LTGRTAGYRLGMAADAEVGHTLAAVAAAPNDQRLEHLDASRVQRIVNGAAERSDTPIPREPEDHP
jgi:hypothetical protein